MRAKPTAATRDQDVKTSRVARQPGFKSTNGDICILGIHMSIGAEWILIWSAYGFRLTYPCTTCITPMHSPMLIGAFPKCLPSPLFTESLDIFFAISKSQD